jgi:hypothetical protein
MVAKLKLVRKLADEIWPGQPWFVYDIDAVCWFGATKSSRLSEFTFSTKGNGSTSN